MRSRCSSGRLLALVVVVCSAFGCVSHPSVVHVPALWAPEPVAVSPPLDLTATVRIAPGSVMNHVISDRAMHLELRRLDAFVENNVVALVETLFTDVEYAGLSGVPGDTDVDIEVRIHSMGVSTSPTVGTRVTTTYTPGSTTQQPPMIHWNGSRIVTTPGATTYNPGSVAYGIAPTVTYQVRLEMHWMVEITADGDTLPLLAWGARVQAPYPMSGAEHAGANLQSVFMQALDQFLGAYRAEGVGAHLQARFANRIERRANEAIANRAIQSPAGSDPPFTLVERVELSEASADAFCSSQPTWCEYARRCVAGIDSACEFLQSAEASGVFTLSWTTTTQRMRPMPPRLVRQSPESEVAASPTGDAASAGQPARSTARTSVESRARSLSDDAADRFCTAHPSSCRYARRCASGDADACRYLDLGEQAGFFSLDWSGPSPSASGE